jgi:hypothetical protein
LANHSKCVVCHKQFVTKLDSTKQKSIGEEAILASFIETGIYIPKTSRCCCYHFEQNSNLLTIQALNELSSVSDSVDLCADDATYLIESLRLVAKKNSTFHKFEFPINIDNRLCLRTTGLTSTQFKEVYDHLTTMKNSQGIYFIVKSK